MRAKRVDVDSKALLDPTAAQWQDVPSETVALGPTPAEKQNSRYAELRARERPYGKLASLGVRSAHNGKDIAFLLEWVDSTQNLDFLDGKSPDGAGILFPLKGDAPLATMGSESQPVNAWFWRADLGEAAENLTAAGLGTVERAGNGQIATASRWEDGTWRVVLARPLAVGGQTEHAARLEPGQRAKVAFAVWDGGLEERAGLKSFSQTWLELELEA
jgi:DMSO reductase family type II enzyme heme b subunit